MAYTPIKRIAEIQKGKIMSAEDTEKDTQQTTTEEVVNTTQVEDSTAGVGTEDTEPEYSDFERKQFERAKEAEAQVKKLRAELKALKVSQPQPRVEEKELSTKDLYALMEAKVPGQDVEEVVRAAKLLGKSVVEALQDDLVKTRLSQLADYRRSAEATNTSASKRSAAKITDEQLVQKVAEGKEVDPTAFAEARWNLFKKQQAR